MKIISKVLDFFFSSSDDHQPTEQELREAELRAEALLKTEKEVENRNVETCEVCGKKFEGENAGRKKGGHKASAH